MKQDPPPPAAEQQETSPLHPILVSDGHPERPRAVENGAGEDSLDSESGKDYELPGRAWAGWVFAAVPLAVTMFGAGREAWSKGLAAILMALLLLIFPARRKLTQVATLGLLGALVMPLLQFLPSSWQAQRPAWWTSLENDWGVQLSHTLTPQAWVAWEGWVFFAICLVWLGWCLARGFSTDQRRAILQALVLGGVIICTLAIVEKLRWIGIPWWPRNIAWGTAFGPFANRNHTSSLAAVTCLLAAAAAYDAHRRKSRAWALFALGMLPPLYCIFFNTSKAGVLLLFLGFTTWFGTVAMRKSFFQKMAVAATLICVIAAIIMISEGGVSVRLKSGETLSGPSTRGILAIETLGMAAQAPWLGVGMQNFESVFPLVTKLNEPFYRYLHPENDLLWLLAEGGLLTAVPAVVLILWIFNATGPWFGKKKKGASDRLDRRLRNAAAIGFGMGALHGLGDVPNHSLGYAMIMALLAGIAVRPRRLRLASAWTDRLAFRVASLGMLAAGVAWIAVALGHDSFPGRSASEAFRSRAKQLMNSGSLADALPLMDRAIQLAPMNAQLYYERARLRLLSGGSKNDALMDFSRCRAVDPHNATLCYWEGLTWLDFDPQYAIIGWREFLRRSPAAAPGIHGYFRQMLHYASRHPVLREPLWSLATTAELKLDFLAHTTTREEFDRCLRSLLAQQPQLEGLESAQREALFELWGRLGDEKALISRLEGTKKWRDDGWRLLASYYARNSDFRSACQTAAAYLPSVNRSPAGSIGDMASLERALLYNPTDARAGIDLFQAQKNSGSLDAAIRTLEKVAKLPNAPTYVQQELAALHASKEDFRRAWEHYQEAMQRR